MTDAEDKANAEFFRAYRVYFLSDMPAPRPAGSPLIQAVLSTSRWSWQRVLFTLTFVVWVGYVIRLYVGYFVVANNSLSFFNHPQMQFPCVTYIPPDLAAKGD